MLGKLARYRKVNTELRLVIGKRKRKIQETRKRPSIYTFGVSITPSPFQLFISLVSKLGTPVRISEKVLRPEMPCSSSCCSASCEKMAVGFSSVWDICRRNRKSRGNVGCMRFMCTGSFVPGAFLSRPSRSHAFMQQYTSRHLRRGTLESGIEQYHSPVRMKIAAL